MRYELESKAHEEFFVLYLDKRLRLIKKILLAKGGIDALSIETMVFFKYAIKLESSNIVLIHNHPHGSLNPSDSDIDTTNNILNIANNLQICVIDHLIISEQGYYSFLENHKL